MHPEGCAAGTVNDLGAARVGRLGRGERRLAWEATMRPREKACVLRGATARAKTRASEEVVGRRMGCKGWH